MISDQKISDSTPSTLAGGDRDRVDAGEALAQRVERARADVAEDDAERRENQQSEL